MNPRIDHSQVNLRILPRILSFCSTNAVALIFLKIYTYVVTKKYSPFNGINHREIIAYNLHSNYFIMKIAVASLALVASASAFAPASVSQVCRKPFLVD